MLVLGYGGLLPTRATPRRESLPLAGIVTAAFGFLLGFPVLRLRGDYLAIVTLGFGEIVRILLLNNTGSPAGRTASARSRNRPSSARVQPQRARRWLGYLP